MSVEKTPKDNILFEDSRDAVLIQGGDEVMRCQMSDEDALHRLLTAFFDYERPEVKDFREAIELFKQDIPKVTDAVRGIIIDEDKLEYKYRNEIHANEVAILPYYISNLNIEYTYTQKMGKYVEFENLCFLDTLDNMGFSYNGKQNGFGFISEENSSRIKKQNDRKISVIIGNPPYNANQANENENNKNREYPEIDQRIRDTFIKNSTAQKTKVYDMYARFYRWAFDRLNGNGIVAFVTNRSFIDSRTFDGFRKIIQNEFEAAYIIDTLSDVRANPKIAGTTHNVFGIQTGVAIMFLVKKHERENKSCKIHYVHMDDFQRKEQKLQWLSENPFRKISFEIVRPDKNNNWINQTNNDFESLLPLCGKDVKFGKNNEAVFELYTSTIKTNRDEWIFDFDRKTLINSKIKSGQSGGNHRSGQPDRITRHTRRSLGLQTRQPKRVGMDS